MRSGQAFAANIRFRFIQCLSRERQNDALVRCELQENFISVTQIARWRELGVNKLIADAYLTVDEVAEKHALLDLSLHNVGAVRWLLC